MGARRSVELRQSVGRAKSAAVHAVRSSGLRQPSAEPQPMPRRAAGMPVLLAVDQALGRVAATPWLKRWGLLVARKCRLPCADELDRLVLAEQIEQVAQRLRRARVLSEGSRASTSAASSRAAPRYLPCTSGRATRKPGRPLCRVPSRSPSPRSLRSSSAMRKPSSVSRKMASRALAVSPSGVL